MSEELEGRKRMDRRGFLGAAAGVAAAGAALGPLAQKGSAVRPTCGGEHPAAIPKIRRGAQCFALPGAVWNTEALFLDHLAFVLPLGQRSWEFANGYPTVDGISLGNGTNRYPATHPTRAGASGWETFGSFAKTYGFRLSGDHGGPSASTAANLGSAVTKMNAWNCNQLGAGGGYPGLPGVGTAITTAAAISAWQASAATMNSWGQAFQTGNGAGVIPTPYGAGVFQGTALTAGRSCARYYRHFHSEQGWWIRNTGTKYDGHYISELIYTETDANVAFAQPDLCWLLEGLWQGGGGPGIGFQGPGDPQPGLGNNRIVAADLVERWQDKMGSFHVKDLGRNLGGGQVAIDDQGASVANVGDNNGPGSATAPFGAVPWDPSQDANQFQTIFERLRHPEEHEFFFERDGQSTTPTANNYYKKIYTQCFDMFDKVLLDRKPDNVRMPYARPVTDAEWAASANLPKHARPPSSGSGAPGPECGPELNTARKPGYTLNVSFKGTFSRFNENDASNYTYLWLRNGAPIVELYNGAATGPGACNTTGVRSYVIQASDVGHYISCQVTANNDQEAASSAVTEAVLIVPKK